MQCWWRTSAGAVRVGEPFSLVLTCAVVETDAAKVVVDQSRLEPSVIQFAPFEVLGGIARRRSAHRRSPLLPVRVPAAPDRGEPVRQGRHAARKRRSRYHVQSRVGQRRGDCRGATRPTCCRRSRCACCRSCRPTPPTFATRTAETFADVDQRAFRANLLIVIGGVLFALAGLMALLALVRLAPALPEAGHGDATRLITDGAILRGVGRELAAVQRAARTTAAGRRSSRAARSAALRIAAHLRRRPAASASCRRSQRSLGTTAPDGPEAGPPDPEGRLAARRSAIAVSGAGHVADRRRATHRAARRNAAPRPALLESLEQALDALHRPRSIGREGSAGRGRARRVARHGQRRAAAAEDRAALADEAACGATAPAPELENRAWSR